MGATLSTHKLQEDTTPLLSFDNPFLLLVGVKGAQNAKGEASTTLVHRHDLSNMHGTVHGGVIMTLLDTTMARAAMSKHGFQLSVVSIGVSVNFLKPGNGCLTTRARVTGGGKSTCFCEGEVFDEAGNLVAKGLGTFKFQKPPAGYDSTTGVLYKPEVIE
jgi:uncharacterized protein (TIGR00369 family)